MMSLWDTNARLKLQGDSKSPYVGMEQLRGYWLNSGSFKTRRFSLVPSFKTRIAVRDNEASRISSVMTWRLRPADADIINDTFLAERFECTWKWYFMT